MTSEYTDKIGSASDPHVDEWGQTTAEYALVLVGAATIASLVIVWAGSTGRIGALLDSVMRSVTGLLA